MVGRRKLLLAVRVWSSEESVHAYRALKAHILQVRRKPAQPAKSMSLLLQYCSSLRATRLGPWGAFVVNHPHPLVVWLCLHHAQPKGDGLWQDELLLVHVSRGIKDRERPWDSGSAVMPSLVTAMSPYTHEVYDTEVRRLLLLLLLLLFFV